VIYNNTDIITLLDEELSKYNFKESLESMIDFFLRLDLKNEILMPMFNETAEFNEVIGIDIFYLK
jgi:hypothetical protein